MMERQFPEAFTNNVIGTRKLASCASRHNAEAFVLVSTDKAVNPTSIMGATKRVAEIIVQRLFAKPGNSTKFMAVRFGNVLGSSGSVVPIFRKQIAEGGPITITHPEVTRYFMTISEAAGLVLQASVLGAGGEIFVLDMGNPIKILDLAKQMLALNGQRLGIDIDVKYTGLLPGEKLFEELQQKSEEYQQTTHSHISKFTSSHGEPVEFDVVINDLETNCQLMGKAVFSERLQVLVPEFTPFKE
jgi:FlaA1/EpsC-like NDP-sugar epimerase